jgi:isoleucyl-tRNA synthetase
MLHAFHAAQAQAARNLLERWSAIRAIRADVPKEMEAVREAGKIGSSLQAEVEHPPAAARSSTLLASLGDDLRFVLICSKSHAVIKADSDALVAQASAHGKCERCWHVREDVGSNLEHPALCGRCVSNLYGEGEARAHA